MNKSLIKRWQYFLLSCLAVLLVIVIQPMVIQPALAQSTTQSITQPTSPHALGQQAYEQGHLTQAINHWQRAIATFAEQQDRRSQALTNIHVVIAYQDLGNWDAATEKLSAARQLAQSLNDDFVFAQLFMAQGAAKLHQGNGTAALDNWQTAEQHYQAIDDATGILQSQLNQAKALQMRGNHIQAFQRLEQLAQSIYQLPSSPVKATGLQTLGETFHAIGEWEQAESALTESLDLAQSLSLTAAIGEIHLSLGNLFRAQDNRDQARYHYQQAAVQAVHPSGQLTADVNQLSLLVNDQQTEAAYELLPTIQSLLSSLPPSHSTLYARVNLAESLLKLTAQASANQQQANQASANQQQASQQQQTRQNSDLARTQISELLASTVEQSRAIQDSQAEAYALGELGHLYELNQQWSEALMLTQQAITIAQNLQAPEIAMPWQWQAGRILKAEKDFTGAIAAYDQAVNSLKSLREELVALSPDVQFSFREQVEPVYRQFVQLLLTDVDSLAPAQQQEQLERSRQLIEDLQLAILDDYFRKACLTATPRSIEAIDPTAAVIYPIWLGRGQPDQRLEVIVSVPSADGEKSEFVHYGQAIAPADYQTLFDTLQATLTPLYRTEEILPAAQTLYQWLLQPAESLLVTHHIQTLVFVTDGNLRNIPMAILHDGNQFLIEKYTLALSPGLQLLPAATAPIDIASQPQALASGLSQQRSGFEALPNVEKEIQQIQQLTPTETLLNQAFNVTNLQRELESKAFPILHLATHGQFSSNLEDTFLLTWDDRLTIQEMETLLSPQAYRQPIELLILSACQTARGDDQAALGLAGMAVRAGARSTLSTLWSVSDASTAQLITHFYQNLTEQTTKATALRQAQLSLLHSDNYNHPYYWAPFVLVGNWQ